MPETLAVTFTGFRLINPFILASAPPTASRSMIERAFEAGWGGAVIKTLAQKEENQLANVTPRIQGIRHKKRLGGFVNMELGSMRGVHEWLDDIAAIKAGFPERMLIASLLYGGAPQESQWREAARLCQEAGADALELNVSCPHGSAEEGGLSAIANRQDLLAKTIQWVRTESSLPVWVKLPVSCDLVASARTSQKAGADALTAINTISALAGFNVETDEPLPTVNGWGATGGLSGRAIRPVALRCIAQLREACDLPVSGVGGLYDWQDSAEALLAGAGCLQFCSAVMEHGYGLIDSLYAGLTEWVKRRKFASLGEAVGRSLPLLKAHRDLDRKFRVRVALLPDSCIRCGRCATSCRDSGYQAIDWEKEGLPVLNTARCDGCGLCVQICPTGSLVFERAA